LLQTKVAGAAPRTPPDFLLNSAQKKVSKEKGGPAGSTPVAGISTFAAFLQLTAAALRGEEAKAVFQSTFVHIDPIARGYRCCGVKR